MTFPTAIEIVSKYLWNNITPPNPNQLASDQWIRGENDTSSVHVDAAAYMLYGAGRFATVDFFNVFKKFFDSDDVSRGTPLAAGSYTLSQVALNLYGSNQNFTLSLQQYFLGIDNADYEGVNNFV